MNKIWYLTHRNPIVAFYEYETTRNARRWVEKMPYTMRALQRRLDRMGADHDVPVQIIEALGLQVTQSKIDRLWDELSAVA